MSHPRLSPRGALTRASRGPSGEAPPPPPWLDDTDLPLDELPPGTPLIRIHRLAHGPISFGPGPGIPATYRFDSPSGAFGVLYAGLGLSAALVETLLRNPARKMVAYGDIAVRASSMLHSGRTIRLVQLLGPGLQRLGCDNAISTGPYGPCGAWADALWSHRSKPDGIAYQSRHDPAEVCVALFERADLGLAAEPAVPLLSQLPVVAKLLSIYGKSVIPPIR